MLEQRTFTGLSSNGRKITGYAAVFDSVASMGHFQEVIRRGAFVQSLNDGGSNIRALYDHDSKALLGTTKASTLQLREDEKGLAFELDLPDTTHGRDVAELVKRGDIAGCSFGFHCRSDNWNGELRELLDVELVEITLTANPAYTDTSVNIRNKGSQQRDTRKLWIETI